MVVARELTKLHEEIWRGRLDQAVSWAEATPLRGEVVLVLGGADETEAPTVSDETTDRGPGQRLARGERTRGVVDDVAGAFGVARRRVYNLALAVREPSGPDGVPAAGPQPE